MPGVLLQFFERLVRLWKSSQIVKVEQLEQVSEDITKLTISLRTDHHATKLAGYCFVSLPNIDPFQFHPFSVSNSLNHTSTEFLIKDMKSELGRRNTVENDKKTHVGSGFFTRRLRDVAIAIEGKQALASQLSVIIEGLILFLFCVCVWPLLFVCVNSYEKVVLIAGGIGMYAIYVYVYICSCLSLCCFSLNSISLLSCRNYSTPMHNVFATMHDEIVAGNATKTPEMVLLWVVRFPETFAMFQRTLDDINQHRVPNMELMLYATRGGKHSSGNEVCDEVSGLRWKQARPNLKKDLAFLENYGCRALVYACGPEPLIVDAKAVAYEFGCHFRRETFEL
ncbi:ferric reductase [Reticulomyxa filosa]|uniref:Ferric reductase n=1 Tax=Reticulomyxa filosa TaxID=46433 RepID=X6M1X1_RETFI|nr:ferric reductase [Reticulomyxa filosa]|eukprot:ETO07387.1 ferric reductase [Reticulomyxa filosa]